MNFELEQSPFLGIADPRFALLSFKDQGWPVMSPGWKAKMCVKPWTRAMIKTLPAPLFLDTCACASRTIRSAVAM